VGAVGIDERVVRRRRRSPQALLAVAALALLGTACVPVDVDWLASDDRGGRDNGTIGSIQAQNYLIDRLGSYAIGLDASASDDDAFKQPIAGGTNILALIPGSDLADEYVIVGAHYDHVTNCGGMGPSDPICNGATDNAAGVAAVLDIARRVAEAPEPPRRSLVLALWDREEDGLVGSRHYVDNPLVPIENTVAYVNFDILGANLAPSLRNVSFAIAAESGGAELQSMLLGAIAGGSLEMQSVSSVFGQGRSDYVNFLGAGVPSVFFSDADGPCYHTVDDEPEIVDYGKLYAEIGVAHRLTEALLATDDPPSFVSGTPVATYADAVVLYSAATRVLDDLALFPTREDQLLEIQAALESIVFAGPAMFDSGDVSTLLSSALNLISIAKTAPCDGYLSP